MANEDAELYISEFNTNVRLLSMQKKDRFAPWVMTGSHTGKQASPVDQVAATEVQQRTARAQPKVITDIANERRWVQPKSFSTHTVLDKFDDIRMNVSLSSPFLASQMAAMNREKEDAMIDAMFATSTVGEIAGSTVTFANDGGVEIAVSTTDLTVDKLLEAQQTLYQGEVDMDDPEEAIICAITPHQHTTLINSEEINNADFIGPKAIFRQDGLLRHWFGINFIITNRILDTSGVRATTNAGAATERACPMWAKSGMHSGIWDNVRGKIVQRLDLDDDPDEMSVYATFGATRLEGVKVIRILCKET